MVLPIHQRPRAAESGWESATSITPVTPTQSSQATSSSQMVLAYEQPLAKLSITRRLGYEILTLVVGQDPKTETLAVHTNVLRELGGYFSQMCNEPDASRIILTNEHPEVVKLLIEFAYSNELPEVSLYATNGEKASQLRYLVQFYAMVDKFGLEAEVRNKTMDKIQEGFYIVGKFPEGPLIHAVYEHSHSHSMLRKLCATSMIYQLHDEQYYDDGVISSFLNSNEELMADFLYAVRAYRVRQDPRIRHCRGDPACAECDEIDHLAGKDGVHPCCFHIHDQIKTEDGGLVDGPCHLWKSG
ncbi:hypothetical protein WAI453_007128 [Rhynchosporium graminicola]|uniref:BTB domain-containing protein n=1 Tax=Rhynchosporium graminicola TaxID=2792576 RepID=A0A1E1LHG1_9HELO|nr:uncharacterized protein RCO7_02261 [Rhynchosporium commune]